MRYQLGLLGAGNMAEAIARAALGQKLLRGDQIIASDPSAARRELFASLGVRVIEDNAAVVAESEQILLAVKPQTFANIAEILKAIDPARQIILSIMAGISTAKIAALIGKDVRVVRIMPNTPMMVGLGMAGIALGKIAKPGDEALALKLFGAAGKAVMVEEKLIDAITAVSGSGPAYVYYLAEAMEQAARDLGLGEHARSLVSQTIVGAAALLAKSPDTAAELRRKVTSPGGTTEAALKVMETRQVGAAVVAAIAAAEARGRELGK